MNIDDLTIKQVRELTAMIGCSGNQDAEPFLGSYVVVRTYSAGVHVGVLDKRVDKKVVLKDARRIWSWEGAFTLSSVSQNGITGGKMSLSVPDILIQDIEIIPCSGQAEKILREYKSHEG